MEKKNNGNSNRNNQSSFGIKNIALFGLRAIGKLFTYILNIIMTILLICLITGAIVGVTFFVYINNYIEVEVDEITALSTDQDLTTRIYYMDYTDREKRVGTPVEIENQQLFSSENRTWVSYESMPTELVEAFVSIEDERFWKHEGVDWKRTAGATFFFMTGRSSFGGSTITQQLIKNVTGEDDVTIQRKVQEIMTALELEKTLEKEDIIEIYLNTIYLSEHCYGVQTAAKTYFGKSVSELNLTECAALAAIPKYPYKYDPYVNPDKNKDRRDDVLYKMHELGKITDEQYENALNTELVLSEKITNNNIMSTTSWYTDVVIEDTIDLLVENLNITEAAATQMLYTGGLHIYTVMDPTVQNILENYFVNDANFAKINQGVQPEASMVITDPVTGDILGLVGGRGEKTQSRVLNYAAQTTRSPGSSIKPVAVYGPAIEYGVVNYGSIINDSPYSGRWPVNYPAGYRGPTTVHDAIRRSVNTVAVKVLNKLGLQASYEFVHDKLGMESVIYEYTTSSGAVLSDLNLSALGLGGMTFGVTVRELTGAYQIFANNGVFTGTRTVVKILDSKGNVIVDNNGEPSQVISPANASIMTMMLQEVTSTGTASRLTFDNKIACAGKTGTTSDDCDRWFMGYTPYYVGGVWFGYAMPMSLNGFSETMSPALQIWEDVMRELHEKTVFTDGYGNPVEYQKKFNYNDAIVSASICSESGLRATKYCEGFIETGYFAAGTIPSKYCDEHDEENTKLNEDKDKETDEDGNPIETDETTETGDETNNGETAEETTESTETTEMNTPETNDPDVE
ncbi:MAG: PBP1A family penicillin-binding protein [Clostridia bacterium]|nr:PBP1A family penicillin-binding protein [Clostridia bacterium]